MKLLGFVVICAIFTSNIALQNEKEFEVGQTEFDEEYGLRDLWEKVKSAANSIGPKIKEDAEKVLKSYKPKILDALKKIGRVVIDAGKEWVIEVRDGVVKIIAEGQEGTSAGQWFEGGKSPVVYNSPNSPVGEKIKEIWGKVKAAFQNLGLKIAAAFKRLGEKIAEVGEKIKKDTAKIRSKIAQIAEKYGEKVLSVINDVIDKYKDIIIDALRKDGKVIIEEGKRIVIEVVNDVVKIIIDGIHALGGKYEVASNDDEAENDLKEIWQKVVAEVMGYLETYKKVIAKMVKKYKPQLIEEWKKIKKIVIDSSKDLVIDFLTEAMKCIMGGCYIADDAKNGWSDIWERIKVTVTKIKGHMSVTTMKILEKYKPKIIDAVQHLKSVVISCGKDLVIQIKDGIIKIITDGAVTMSDDSIAADFIFEDDYVQLIFTDEENEITYGFKDGNPNSSTITW